MILREAISNAIHACIIEKQRRKDTQGYISKISIEINSKNNLIIIKDNGIGFSIEDKEIFFNIAERNKLKIENNLPTKGLGRLAYAHFSEEICFDSVSDNKKISFKYPPQNSLFDELKQEPLQTNENNGTILTLRVRENLLSAFVNKYKNNIEKLKEWILDNFAFLFYDLNKLEFSVSIDEKNEIIPLDSVEKEDYSVTIQRKKYDMFLLSVNGNEKLVAHKLLVNKNLKYDRDIKGLQQTIYVASPLLDDRITQDGLSVEIEDIREDIEEEVTKILDKKFKKYFENQRNKSIDNLSKSKQKFPFLADFMPKPSFINGYKIVKNEGFRQIARFSLGEKLGKDFVFIGLQNRANLIGGEHRAV